jgi:glycolate oxidase subunit GlcD
MDKALIDGLIELIGKEAVVADATRLLTYESDALAMYHEKADLVILPADTAQTAACMKLIASFGVPIVPRGAGTGLTGGARPIKGGVVVATSRMRQVFEVNPTDGYARTGAGLVNVDLTHACEDHGLFYAPDPSSQRACTIGGNVANNSGGPHGFKYGSTTQHILGLVIVLADGEVLDLSEPRVDPDGLDLIGLFVGSEGTFGIATEVTVKLVPTPEIVETLLAVYTGDEGLSEACDTVSEIIRVGLEPSAIEILDTLTIAAVEDSVFAAGYPRDASAVLLMEVEGTPTEVQGTSSDIMKLAKAFGAVELRRAKTEAERAMLWAGRKGAFGAMGRIAPDLYVADAVVPRTKLREMVRTTVAIAEKYKLKPEHLLRPPRLGGDPARGHSRRRDLGSLRRRRWLPHWRARHRPREARRDRPALHRTRPAGHGAHPPRLGPRPAHEPRQGPALARMRRAWGQADEHGGSLAACQKNTSIPPASP